uniref:Thymidine kinase, cytosolic n=1 Tax=Cyanistes caeruleus TaxID=156563 RepID=A0A8C0VHU8_CYACU
MLLRTWKHLSHRIRVAAQQCQGDLRAHVLRKEVGAGRGSRGGGGLRPRPRPADTVSCSTELMRRVRRFQLAQYRCLLVKYAKDTRYSSSGVSTHDKSTMEALPAGLLQDVYQEALAAAVIGIDEGQFVSARLGWVCWALRDTDSLVHPVQTRVCVPCRRGWEIMPCLIHVACAFSETLLPYSPCRQEGGTGAHFTDRAHGSDFPCSWCCCLGMHCGIWSQVLPPILLYNVPVPPPVPRYCGVLRDNGKHWENHHRCCSGWDFPEEGLWEHPEPGATGGERGEAERCVHGVLPRGLLHQEAGSRAGG